MLSVQRASSGSRPSALPPIRTKSYGVPRPKKAETRTFARARGARVHAVGGARVDAPHATWPTSISNCSPLFLERNWRQGLSPTRQKPTHRGALGEKAIIRLVFARGLPLIKASPSRVPRVSAPARPRSIVSLLLPLCPLGSRGRRPGAKSLVLLRTFWFCGRHSESR